MQTHSSTPSLVFESSSSSSSSPSSTAAHSSVSSLVSSAAASTEQLVPGSLRTELAEGVVVALNVQAEDGSNEWELEAANVDRAVCVLLGVKTMLVSIPKGRYAIATSGAKTYGARCASLPPLLLFFFSICDWRGGTDRCMYVSACTTYGSLAHVGTVYPRPP